MAELNDELAGAFTGWIETPMSRDLFRDETGQILAVNGGESM